MKSRLYICVFVVINVVFTSCIFEHVEKVELFNPVSNENIYLKYYTWGLDDEVNVISLRKTTEWPDSITDYITKTSKYYYKMQNDTLYLYGVWYASLLNVDKNFKTRLVFKMIENYESIDLLNTYKEKGLEIFPPSRIRD